MRVFFFLLACGMIAARPGRAQELPERMEHGQELMRASSALSFRNTFSRAHTVLTWALPKVPAREALDALQLLCERSFPPETTAARIQNACDARYNSAQVEAIIAWFTSDLGTKVADAERSAAALTDSRQGQIREQVRAQWVSSRRLLLLGRLDDNLGTGSLLGEAALVLLEDLLTTLQRESTVRTEWPDSRIQRVLDEATGRLESRLRDSVLFDMRVRYRSLSTDDLQGYNEFLESFNGRRYVEMLRHGLEAAFGDGRELFIEGAPRIPLRTRLMVVP